MYGSHAFRCIINLKVGIFAMNGFEKYFRFLHYFKPTMLFYFNHQIKRIDTENDVGTTFGVVSSEKNKWQGGILLDGVIYAIPSNARHILCIDTETFKDDGSVKYSLLGNLPPTKDKWQGNKKFFVIDQ